MSSGIVACAAAGVFARPLSEFREQNVDYLNKMIR